MNCKKTLKNLPLYLSDDLSKSDIEAMDSHLKRCMGCYREYQAHLKSYRALKRLSEKPDLESTLRGFTDGVMARVASEPSGPAASTRKPARVYRIHSSYVAAAILLLVTGLYFLLDDDTPVNRDRHNDHLADNPGEGHPGEGNPVVSEQDVWAIPDYPDRSSRAGSNGVVPNGMGLGMDSDLIDPTMLMTTPVSGGNGSIPMGMFGNNRFSNDEQLRRFYQQVRLIRQFGYGDLELILPKGSGFTVIRPVSNQESDF